MIGIMYFVWIVAVCEKMHELFRFKMLAAFEKKTRKYKGNEATIQLEWHDSKSPIASRK